MYPRRRIFPLAWTMIAVVALVLIVVVLASLDFPGWVVRGLSRMVPEGRGEAYTAEEVEEMRDRIGNLEGENALLKEQVVRLQDEATIRESDLSSSYEILTAQIIYRDHGRLFGTAIIDRGSADGVSVGMPVVDSQGLAGRIVSTRAAVSRIVLITSPDCSFGVMDQRSRELGVVRGSDPVRWRLGTGSDSEEGRIPPDVLELEYLSPSADISVHDTLITSGLSGITPPGIRIGEVVEIVSGTEQDMYNIRVRLFADLDHIRTVGVVLYREEDRRQIEELVEEAGTEMGPPVID